MSVDPGPFASAWQAFGDIMELGAQFWARIVLYFDAFPWKLIRLVDARVAETEKHHIRHLFLDCPSCELDPGFAEPLRESF